MTESKHIRPLLIPTIISRVFDPILLFILLAILAIGRSGLSTHSRSLFLGTVLGCMVLPVVIALVWAIKTKKISNWDVHSRRQRVKILPILLVFSLFNIYLLYSFGDIGLSHLFFFFWLWLLGFSGITLLYKISGHTGILALFSALIVVWFGWPWIWVVFFVPLVAWARLVRQDHTFGQVIAGISYSWILVALAHGIGFLV